MPQFDVLAELARAPEQGFTFVEFSRLLLVTSGNLTGIIDRLEDEGLVKREPELADRRVTRMRLTPARAPPHGRDSAAPRRGCRTDAVGDAA